MKATFSVIALLSTTLVTASPLPPNLSSLSRRGNLKGIHNVQLVGRTESIAAAPSHVVVVPG